MWLWICLCCCFLLPSILTRVRFMVFNATFNNISAISWWSVLLVEETRVLGENKSQHILSHTVVLLDYTLRWAGFEFTALVVIDTDFIDSCKSNYHAITTTKLSPHTTPICASYHIYWNSTITLSIMAVGHVNQELPTCRSTWLHTWLL